MKKLIASTPNAEVLGESILGYLNCVRHAEIQPILDKYGLEDIQARKWYSHQMMLNVLRDISEDNSIVTESLIAIGIKIMEIATVPPTITSVDAILPSLATVYRQHHRNVTELGWLYRPLGPGHVLMTHDGPYPDDQSYGIIYGAVKRFKPKDATFSVTLRLSKHADNDSMFDVQWDVSSVRNDSDHG